MLEQFLSTNGAIARAEVPNAAAYPKISLKANGKHAYHYGVSSNISSFTFTHKLELTNDLMTWGPDFDTSVSAEFRSYGSKKTSSGSRSQELSN